MELENKIIMPMQGIGTISKFMGLQISDEKFY
jgi:hypothetical protein